MDLQVVSSQVNALSIVTRFVKLEQGTIRKVPDLVSTFEAVFAAAGAEMPLQARIFTSWHAAEPAKMTRLLFEDDRLLILNHQATAGQLFAGTTLVTAWGSDGIIERLTAHYMNALRVALNRSSSTTGDLYLHSLLLGTQASQGP